MGYVFFEILLTRDCVEDIHRPGDAEEATRFWMDQDPIKTHLERIPEADLRAYVEHGILYDDPERVALMDRDELELYTLWDLACSAGDSEQGYDEAGQTWGYAEAHY